MLNISIASIDINLYCQVLKKKPISEDQAHFAGRRHFPAIVQELYLQKVGHLSPRLMDNLKLN